MFDFGWGNPYFLLELLDSHYGCKILTPNIVGMSYAPDNGMEALIKLTKESIIKSTGVDYKYIFLTNGATQAISSVFKHESILGNKNVYMQDLGYPFYDSMVKNAQLTRRAIKKTFKDDSFVMLDMPSNPLGRQDNCDLVHERVYWDAVYQSDIYNANPLAIPYHLAMVGTYSKLLGLTGIRVGWIATDDHLLYQKLSDISLKDTGTISKISQTLLIDILKNINIENFIKEGGRHLNYNREEFQKIEYIFDNQPVQSVGMFYCAKADKKALDLLNKSNIIYTQLNNDMVRLSMGNTLSITKEGIRNIIKKDSI